MSAQAIAKFDLSQFQDLSLLESSDEETNQHDQTQHTNEAQTIEAQSTNINDQYQQTNIQPVPFDQDQFDEANQFANGVSTAATNPMNGSSIADLQDMTELQSSDEDEDDDFHEHELNEIIDIIPGARKDSNIEFTPKNNETLELLVAGYLRRECPFDLTPNIIYQCNIAFGSIQQGHAYKFGDITKGTIRSIAESKAVKSATAALKNIKVGNLTKSMFGKLKRKNNS